MSDVLAQANQNLPYVQTISISGRSIYGANDVTLINKKLGLSSAQISSNCILTVRGVMQTDVSPYIIDGPPTLPQVVVHYDGMIKSYIMTGVAMCTAGQLPPGSGLITEVGNRYSIPLQMIKCPLPTQQASQLTITYNGSGTSQCVYQ
jgi:hypothetical protein